VPFILRQKGLGRENEMNRRILEMFSFSKENYEKSRQDVMEK
jgi:hypothetical protein